MRQMIAHRDIGLANHNLQVWYDPDLDVCGKYWIFVKNIKGQSVFREKAFSGETAWSDAERYANDLVFKYEGNYEKAITL